MPYIDKEAREKFQYDANPPAGNAGELNYLISCLCIEYIQFHGLRYQQVAEITGVLENVKQELYRRYFGPYEDKKRIKHGEIP